MLYEYVWVRVYSVSTIPSLLKKNLLNLIADINFSSDNNDLSGPSLVYCKISAIPFLMARLFYIPFLMARLLD
jgi:hypothetical protein